MCHFWSCCVGPDYVAFRHKNPSNQTDSHSTILDSHNIKGLREDKYAKVEITPPLQGNVCSPPSTWCFHLDRAPSFKYDRSKIEAAARALLVDWLKPRIKNGFFWDSLNRRLSHATGTVFIASNTYCPFTQRYCPTFVQIRGLKAFNPLPNPRFPTSFPSNLPIPPQLLSVFAKQNAAYLKTRRPTPRARYQQALRSWKTEFVSAQRSVTRWRSILASDRRTLSQVLKKRRALVAQRPTLSSFTKPKPKAKKRARR